MSAPELETFSQPAGVYDRAAQIFREVVGQALSKRGLASVALSGGGTPTGMYNRLAGQAMDRSFNWSAVHFFFSDERLVPLTDPRSNYKLAKDHLISRSSIPLENVHPVETDLDRADAAGYYQMELFDFFSGLESDPVFDLLFLGLGADGHTASLLPNSRAVDEDSSYVTSVSGSFADPPVDRVSFTLPLINLASTVVFLVVGSAKGSVVKSIFGDPERAAEKYPAALVKPQGRLIWLIDRDAAP